MSTLVRSASVAVRPAPTVTRSSTESGTGAVPRAVPRMPWSYVTAGGRLLDRARVRALPVRAGAGPSGPERARTHTRRGTHRGTTGEDVRLFPSGFPRRCGRKAGPGKGGQCRSHMPEWPFPAYTPGSRRSPRQQPLHATVLGLSWRPGRPPGRGPSTPDPRPGERIDRVADGHTCRGLPWRWSTDRPGRCTRSSTHCACWNPSTRTGTASPQNSSPGKSGYPSDISTQLLTMLRRERYLGFLPGGGYVIGESLLLLGAARPRSRTRREAQEPSSPSCATRSARRSISAGTTTAR